METQITNLSTQQDQQQQATGTFQPGATVVYGMHGKCTVLGIETRNVGNEAIHFYKIEVQKSALSRSTRQEPAIWVPVATARERGMRAPLDAQSTEAVYKAVNNREYYFQINESWSSVQPKIENAIRTEGAIGLAKALSFLHVLKRKQIVPSSEVTRLYDNVAKLLVRELSEATGEQIRNIEDKLHRGLKQKLIPDT